MVRGGRVVAALVVARRAVPSIRETRQSVATTSARWAAAGATERPAREPNAPGVCLRWRAHVQQRRLRSRRPK